ncbi:iron-containing redox enzyme family protein [Asanoa sp. NPDC049573]|uniref:iron-containing redox enzyme family protein n=1 Tax=Asanoa sp. NPDC049573 TaxID=3155396 RepID=UPI003413C299
MRLPEPRGPVSATLVDALRRAPHAVPAAEATDDEDLQLALFICYELHYRGWHQVDPAWEWDPSLLALRAGLEQRFETGLRDLVDEHEPVAVAEVPRALAALVAADDRPPNATASGYLQRHATREQFIEFVVHRSVYHLKEADPHTWGIPRLAGRAKAALIEIQLDEYGGGRPERMHAELFRSMMDSIGIDSTYGVHVDAVPAVTLATSNLISLFGLHRRLRGALVGHLAAFEMTSSIPNRRYRDGLRRLGGGHTATRFFDEHVEADAVHEQIAAVDLCGGFVAAEEDQKAAAVDVLFGAACCLAVDAAASDHMLNAWHAGRSSLRTPR